MSPRMIVALVLAMTACDDSGKAIDPVWGKQACGSCSMLVSEPRYAAELTTADGTRVFFDDPGCMAAYVEERHVQPAHMWVRTSSGTWVNAHDIHYARGERTPMDFGFTPADNGDASWGDLENAAKNRLEKGGS
jgi:copper chaperone NosL